VRARDLPPHGARPCRRARDRLVGVRAPSAPPRQLGARPRPLGRRRHRAHAPLARGPRGRGRRGSPRRLMVTLRIIPERLLDARPSGERRYAQNLGAMLIARAPAGCDVEAILPKVSDDEAEHVSALLPGLTDITQGPRRREALGTAWRRGLRTLRIGGGFIHAMSLYAPMRDISLSYGID